MRISYINFAIFNSDLSFFPSLLTRSRNAVRHPRPLPARHTLDFHPSAPGWKHSTYAHTPPLLRPATTPPPPARTSAVHTSLRFLLIFIYSAPRGARGRSRSRGGAEVGGGGRPSPGVCEGANVSRRRRRAVRGTPTSYVFFAPGDSWLLFPPPPPPHRRPGFAIICL